MYHRATLLILRLMNLSIVLPCYNEEENIPHTIADVSGWMNEKKYEGEIIAVNDGSADTTGKVLEGLLQKYPRLKVLHHAHNKGYGEALITGLDVATMDIIGFMDSDGQFHAEDFDNLLLYIHEYDFVTGRRSRRADPFIRSVNAFLYGSLVKIALRIFVRDINCGMKIFKRSIWQTVRPRCASGALFNAEVFLRAKGNSIAWKQVSVPHFPRTAGSQTGAKISVILRMFLELFQLRSRYNREQKEQDGKKNKI